MMLTLHRYTFTVEYCKGSTLHIAETLSRAPQPITSHKQVQDELVYRGELEAEHPNLSGFQDATLQEIRVAALTDPEQRTLLTLKYSKNARELGVGHRQLWVKNWIIG